MNASLLICWCQSFARLGRRWACALTLVSLMGCAGYQCQLPRIDPSGDRIFLPPGAPTPPPYRPHSQPGAVVVAPPQAAPPVVMGPPPLPAPYGTTEGVSVTPARIVAPIHSEVILLASICGGDGYMVTDVPVEWTIAPTGAGHLVGLGERGGCDWVNHLHGYPRKVTDHYAVNRTAVATMFLDRGTPNPADDVTVQAGQAWVSVSSPVEGTSQVTAMAPTTFNWERRQQTATIHWIDAQFTYPAPVAAATGGRATLTTRLNRLSDGAPLAGWIVRYEMAGGPTASVEGIAQGDGPTLGGGTSGEAISNSAGEATLEIAPANAESGNNLVAIQVFRPAGLVPGETQRVLVGQGATSVAWSGTSSSGLGVTVRTSAVDNDRVVYQIDVSNPSSATASDVILTDQSGSDFEFLNSSPTANSSPSGQEWKLGDIRGGGTVRVEANYRLLRDGALRYCVNATSRGGATGKGCATSTRASGGGYSTEPAAPELSTSRGSTRGTPQLSVDIVGPTEAQLDENLHFEIRITNTGSEVATGVVIADTYDSGLQHATETSPIRTDPRNIEPGRTIRAPLDLRAVAAGRQCQEVVATADGGVRSTPVVRCVEVIGNARTRDDRPSSDSVPPPSFDDGASNSEGTLVPEIRGPVRRSVGEIASFEFTVENRGKQTLRNVTVTFDADIALRPVAPSGGSPSKNLSWTIPELPPGSQSTVERINCTCDDVNPQACARIKVVADGMSATKKYCVEIAGDSRSPAAPNLSPSQGRFPADNEANFPPTRRTFETPSNAPLEVSLTHEGTPRVGEIAKFRLVVKNRSSQDVAQVTTTLFPSEVAPLKGVAGSKSLQQLENGGTSLEPLQLLRPGETYEYELRFQANRSGRARVEVQVSSRANPKTPVTAEDTAEITD